MYDITACVCVLDNLNVWNRIKVQKGGCETSARRCTDCIDEVAHAEQQLKDEVEHQQKAVSLNLDENEVRQADPTERESEPTSTAVPEEEEEPSQNEERETDTAVSIEDNTEALPEENPITDGEPPSHRRNVRDVLPERKAKLQDLERLYTAIENVQQLDGNDFLIENARRLYNQYTADITLGEEILALEAQR